MLIKDVMTKDVISVNVKTPIEEVANLLISHKIHGVPVVDGNKPIGIITETDFFTKGSLTVYLPEYISFLKKDSPIGKILPIEKERMTKLLETSAGDVMSSPCITINAVADVKEFFDMVKGGKLISVPVVDGEGFLVGIITLTDIIGLINLNQD